MNKIKKPDLTTVATALIIAIVSAAVIWGAWRGASKDKTVPLKNPEEVYSQAIQQATSLSNVYYKVTGTKTMTVDSKPCTESFTQLITYEGYKTDKFRGCVEEDLTIGNHQIKSFEYFADNVAYFATQGASYQAAMDKDAYTNRYTPAVTVTGSLYSTITGTTNRRGSTIQFSNPTKIEQWLDNGKMILVNASGTAALDETGRLSATAYTIDYTENGIAYHLQTKVEIIYNNTTPITIPNTAAYKPIDNIDVPKMLERSCGYLSTLTDISSTYRDKIICQAFGDAHEKTVALTIGAEENWSALIETTTSRNNSSKPGDVKTLVRRELFEDGAYSYTVDGTNYAAADSIDLAAMQDYCQNLLIGTVLLPEYIEAVEIIETDTAYQILIKPTADFADILAQDACLTLYQNATVLAETAQSYTVDDVACYLYLDKKSGLPYASGFRYSGTYMISDLPYQLAFEADQTYAIPTSAAPETVPDHSDKEEIEITQPTETP